MPGEILSIADLKRAASNGALEARLHVQVQAIQSRNTREGKPYWEIAFADAQDRMTLRVWSDSPAFARCGELGEQSFVELSGEFANHPTFGVDAKRWSYRLLDDEEKAALLGGPAELRAKQAADFEYIVERVAAIGDPRLRVVAETFLADFGERFRRTAAARNYHHARRGGLVEHVAQMMRAAVAIGGVYPALNPDLLLAGVLFHDCGKLWENSMPESDFTMPYSEPGELLGHISIGVELVNTLWRKVMAAPESAAWAGLVPPSEHVRVHLLHLIAAHHGDLQFGSPVLPKTPEAHALHYIDNLDAKLEMMFAGYRTATLLAPRIYERVRPLPGNLVAPLERFDPASVERTDAPQG